MSDCKDCKKGFASRQSLSNHRKRVHPGKTVPPGLRFSDSLLKSKAEDEKKNTKDVQDAQDVQDASPPAGKKTKVSKIVSTIDTLIGEPAGRKRRISKIVSTDLDSDTEDSDAEELDSVLENIEGLKDKKKQNSLLTDVFIKLYSDFDENDVELCNDILTLLDQLKTRGCVTEREYKDIKSRLVRKMHLNLYESIDSTVENMIQDDKKEVLGLLRSMKKDEEAKKLVALVKDYFEEEMELESVLHLIPKLKDKLNAQKVKIILKQIEKTRNRVNEIFTQLTNGSDKRDILNGLRSSNHITDEQYDKLSIGPHTLPSISRIIQGRGMYLSRNSHYM